MSIPILVFFTVLVGAIMQRVAGMGVGLIAAPVLALAIGPVEGVLVVNILAAVNAAVNSIAVRQWVDWARFWKIASTMVVGSFAGVLLIQVIAAASLQAIVGALLLTALGMTTLGQRFVPKYDAKSLQFGLGIITGFTNTVAGVAGPPIAVYAQASRWDTRTFTSTLQPLFMVSGAISAILKLSMGTVDLASASVWVWVAGFSAMAAGILIGARLATRVDRENVRVLALTLATAGAAVALVRGLLAM